MITWLPVWISKHMTSKVPDKITYLLPIIYIIFQRCTIAVWEWISNFIPHFTMDVFPFCNYVALIYTIVFNMRAFSISLIYVFLWNKYSINSLVVHYGFQYTSHLRKKSSVLWCHAIKRDNWLKISYPEVRFIYTHINDQLLTAVSILYTVW